MKFKMKGQKAARNKLVTTRANMKNDANYSLFSDKETYKLGWGLGFKDRSISNRFQRDLEAQSYAFAHYIVLPKWAIVYFIHAAVGGFYFDLIQLLSILIIPVCLDFTSIRLRKTFMLGRLFYSFTMCYTKVLEDPIHLLLFLIIAFGIDVVTMLGFVKRILLDALVFMFYI